MTRHDSNDWREYNVNGASIFYATQRYGQGLSGKVVHMQLGNLRVTAYKSGGDNSITYLTGEETNESLPSPRAIRPYSGNLASIKSGLNKSSLPTRAKAMTRAMIKTLESKI